MIRLPLIERETLAALLTTGLPAESLDRPATGADIAGGL